MVRRDAVSRRGRGDNILESLTSGSVIIHFCVALSKRGATAALLLVEAMFNEEAGLDDHDDEI